MYTQPGTRRPLRGIEEIAPRAEPVETAWGEAARLNRLLANLLDNALRYSTAHAPLEIAARVLADHLEMTVADRGVGINPSDFRHVFDQFYRVQRPEGVSGTGLGLSVSKGIIEAHGGSIEAQNRPGGRTTIRLTLPLDDRQPLAPETEQ
jgi:two-component system sensor histidine kinase KdpD